MESVLRWLIHDGGLPMPQLQHPVRDATGVAIADADMAWPARKVIVEFDGDVHRERTTFVRDRRRQNRLVAAGWVILRFTSADVYGDPQGVLAQIRRALGL
jgi:very-short-patch-repair endonuclease